MRKLVRIGARAGIIAVAGTVAAAGLIMVQPADDGSLAFKRDDDAVDVIMTVDDDDDDDDDTSRSRATGNSRSRADNTNSRKTRVSRDRDRSRGDLTRDFTRDGPGGLKRDWSKNHTNDRSRNDTRR